MKDHRRVIASDCQAAFEQQNRRGGFIVLAVFCLVACLAAAALSIDVGYITVQQTRMQNAVDAAALAAAQEISYAVQNAPADSEDPTAYALNSARTTASYVAGLSDIFVDPAKDVRFGQRTYNSDSDTWTTTWEASPANVVKVTARRTNDDPGAQDGKLKLFFGGAIGTGFGRVTTEAVAYIEARDIAVVHDFSRSMNFDSYFNSEAQSRLTDSQILSNLQKTWSDLQPLNAGALQFEPQYLQVSDSSYSARTTVTFKYDKVSVTTNTELREIKVYYESSYGGYGLNDATGGFDGSVSFVGYGGYGGRGGGSSSSDTFDVSGRAATIEGDRNIKKVEVKVRRSSGSNQTTTQTFEDSVSNVLKAFDLDDIPYPYPAGSWSDFVEHCREYEPYEDRGYLEMYSGMQFCNYIMQAGRCGHNETPALCMARHYPFSSIKQGHSLLCDFLKNLQFDDHIGMVSYDNNHRIETTLNDPYYSSIPQVNISSEPLTNDYDAVNNLMKYKQAGHYSYSTNMGGGFSDGISLLNDHGRAGANPTILLMTDGNANAMDWNAFDGLPRGWDWDELLDFDGDGESDYETNNTYRMQALSLAYSAARQGIKVHTMCVGQDGDRELMQAIAHIGGGIYIDIPGGSSAEEMEGQLLEAFRRIAGMVPPAKLINPEG